MTEETTVDSKTDKLADAAYRTVLDKILTCQLPGGSVIQERKLAELMGISRTPMRDALGRLEGEGLLVRLTQRLLAVRVISLEDYLHSLDVRAVIEPMAAGLAAKRFSHAAYQALETELAALEAIEQPPAEMHWSLDDHLHETIAENSGNPFLAKIIRDMRRYTKIFEQQTIPARYKPGVEDHRRILEAVGSGRPDKARDAMAEHIRRVRKRILDSL